MPLPLKTTKAFVELIKHAEDTPGEFPQLASTVLAQMALESGWGTSGLASQYFNYAGMKWREMMSRHATPVLYKAWDGPTKYCKFKNNSEFWNGYWHRLDAHTSYDGWREHTKTGDDFIRFVGPIWLGMSREHNAEYVEKVRDIRARHFPSQHSLD